LSALAMGAVVVGVGCSLLQPSEPPKVELPVSKAPGRASNEEMVSRAGPGERAVAPAGEGAPGVTVIEPSGQQPTTVASGSAKRQAAAMPEAPASAPVVFSP